MTIIDNKFEHKQIVYLKTDEYQKPRIIYSITVYDSGLVGYGLACGVNTSTHYDFEISAERDTVKALTND